MALVKPRAFVQSFNSGRGRFNGGLLFGMNWELLSRLKSQTIKAFGSSFPDAEIVRFSDSDLSVDPGRLLEELQSISMFGREKLVVVDATTASVHKALIGAISVGWRGCSLLATAGDLKKSSPLRKEFEASPELVTAICYEQSRAELVELAQTRLQEHSVTADRGTLEFIVDAVEGNAALLEPELAKIVCFVGPGGVVDFSLAQQIVAGNDAGSVDNAIDAALGGRVEAAVQAIGALRFQGQNPSSFLITMTNHCTLLLDLAVAVQGGRRAAATVREWRPPIFFKRHDALISQLETLDIVNLKTLLEQLRVANAEVRLKPDLGWAVAERFSVAAASMQRSGRKLSA